MLLRSPRPLALASALLTPAFGAFAADGDMPVTHVSTNKNRLTLNARFGLNIDAKFKSAPFGPRTVVGGTGSALEHFYEDGYVRVDSSGNAGGTTWFWGYNDASQVSGDSILFHSTAGSGDASTGDVNCDPHYGVELVFNREFGRFGRDTRWGLEAGLGWTSIALSDRSTLSGGLTRVTDAYSFMPGTTPPAAPFAGTFTGPNFEINDSPSRSFAPLAGGSIRGQRDFDADLFVGRVGPYVEFPLGEHCLLAISGGLAVGGICSDFSWRETVSGPANFTHQGSGTDGDILLGGFVGATFTYAFNERWSLDAGGQFMSLGNYSHAAGGAKAELDLGKMFWFSAGVSYSF